MQFGAYEAAVIKRQQEDTWMLTSGESAEGKQAFSEMLIRCFSYSVELWFLASIGGHIISLLGKASQSED